MAEKKPKVDLVKIDGFYVEAPKGQSDEDRAAFLEAVQTSIANDRQLQAKAERHARNQAAFAERLEASREERDRARLAALKAKYEGGEQPT